MRGTSHAMSGAAAGTVVGLAAPTPALAVTCVVVSAVAALGPDIDHPHSHASRCLGPITWLLCRIVRGMSRVLGLPAHRGLSHTVVTAVFAGMATTGGLLLAGMPPRGALVVGGAVAVGWLTALAGDWVTKTSLPHLWWPFIAESHGPPRWLRITTGKWVESVIMWLVFVPATCFGLWFMLLH
jgi:inner membrane protein